MKWLVQQQALIDNLDNSPLQERSSDLFLPSVNASRLGLYRRNTVGSLMESLKAKFFCVRTELGDDSFDYICLRYVEACPSKNSNLDHYGESFPCFLITHDKTRAYPFLEDLAKLDWCLHLSYIAPIESQEALDVGEIKGTFLKFRADFHIIRSQFSLFAIWQALQKEDGSSVAGNLEHPQNVVISRDEDLIPQVYPVEKDYADLIERINPNLLSAEEVMSHNTNTNSSVAATTKLLQQSIANKWLLLVQK